MKSDAESSECGLPAEDAVVVALKGDALVGGIADLRWRMDTILRSGTSTLVLDVSDVARLSSATVAMLLWVARRCQASGVRLLVQNPSRASLELLQRTGLLEVLDVVGLAGFDNDGARAPAPPAMSAPPTRVKLWGGASAPSSARSIARQWCRERVLPKETEERLAHLLSDFVSYALVFEPRSVSLTLGWRDPDHVVGELKWRGRALASVRAGAIGPPYSATKLASEWTDEWGYDVRKAVRSAWWVIDAGEE